MKPDMLQAALDYAARGWSVVPLHVPLAVDKCSCGKRTCASSGKHPRTKNGLSDGSLDPDVLRGWWTRWPDANIGILTGRRSGGLVVVDVDNDRGGDDNIRDLAERHGNLPETGISLTGHGMHVLFISADDVSNSVDRIARGVDVRGEGGYFVAPPSLHFSGRRYEWEGSSDPFAEDGAVPIARLPQWLAEAASNRNKVPIPPAGAPIAEGGRNEILFRLGCRLRRNGIGFDAIFSALCAENAARCVPPIDEDEVRKIAEHASKYDAAMPYDATMQHAPHAEPISPAQVNNQSWTAKLLRKPPNPKTGVADLVPCSANASIVLCHDTEWKMRDGRPILIWDSFSQMMRTVGAAPWFEEDLPTGGAQPGLWREEDTVRLSHWLHRAHGMNIKPGVCIEAALIAAQKHTVNPVMAYLSSLEWDNTPRLSYWLHYYAGAENTPYIQAVSRWWLISAVARAFKPGEKVDHTLILEGPQGEGKSKLFKTLVPNDEWFLDTPFEIGSKDGYLAIRGKLIVELAELVALLKSDPDTAKAFLTSSVDTYRQPYGRGVGQFPRTCVFGGTINPEDVGYLSDPTGARRFWPVRCGEINVDGLAAVRDQLWAEAVNAYQNGEEFWPPKDKRQMMADEVELRYRGDVWEPLVLAWLRTHQCKTILDARERLPQGPHIMVSDVLESALDIERGRMSKADQVRAGVAMSRSGWAKGRKRIGQGFITVYQPPPGWEFDSRSNRVGAPEF